MSLTGIADDSHRVSLTPDPSEAKRASWHLGHFLKNVLQYCFFMVVGDAGRQGDMTVFLKYHRKPRLCFVTSVFLLRGAGTWRTVRSGCGHGRIELRLGRSGTSTPSYFNYDNVLGGRPFPPRKFTFCSLHFVAHLSCSYQGKFPPRLSSESS